MGCPAFAESFGEASKSPMCEHGQTASHTGRQGEQNIRPKQLRLAASRLRNREVSWEGSQRSKLMSRRIPIRNRDAARVHVLTQGGLRSCPVCKGGSGGQ